MSRISPNIAGKTFGRLTAISKCRSGASGHARWLCKCQCGRTKPMRSSHLLSGVIQSCGCYREENRSRFHFIHGMARSGRVSREFKSWQGMRNRCENPKARGYQNYGGRGIKVCRRWASFRAFFADMGRCPPGLTLDRRNNDGDYEPTNCRWATRAEQSRNRRPSSQWKRKARR